MLVGSELTGRPWWRKKRWIAAVLLGTIMFMPLAVGPLESAAHRGWLPMEAMYPGGVVAYVSLYTPLAGPYGRYRAWWWGLGEMPDYEVTVVGKSISYIPTNRYYHSHHMPQVKWRLSDGW
jgi:hypothetical protein